ncbi:hypothetical protein [Maribacter sp. HTCC2170]|uniref:hypothetical protein n=1 Tax=Maribacter sp. (strain HTCC2170 / KCCM 42371) TaxID=313603 RepID=UPI00006AFD19|nr:hypothetical protein [Maribacter sp. HTCC2170]EAR01241.1 hypothetical protein FB2170_10991 [Maribacter sp. HTCC2170]
MDNFEKHIQENAAEFDEHKADKAKLWANIAQELKVEEPKVIPLWKSPMIRIAASVLLLIGLAGFIGMSVLKTSTTETQYVSKELLDIDVHYKNLVSYQVELVQNHPKLSDADKTEFLSFMDELDDEYAQLRLEMRNNLDNQRVLEAIISNYKQRITLIEKLLQQINDSKITNEDYGYIL